ncbi:MAG TPA: MFS transporter [Pseudomonadota bacterium]|nr:MFS transporter [Pseudomonadota bacterium]HNN49596.1 MFS transporter [Pseudomonadota bacterium]
MTQILFVLIVGLLFADQNLLAPNLTAIGNEFGFSRAEIDQRLGADVNLLFWMLGGVLTLIVGYLADRGDLADKLSRKWLLTIVAVIGQLACLGSGLAKTYDQLLWARALTGIGIGGAFPLIYSLIGDYYPPHKRASATATLGLSQGLGIGLGQLLSGMLGAQSGWRMPFYVVALPGLALSVLFALFAKEPRRGQHEEGLHDLLASGKAYEERLRLRDLPQLFAVKTNLLILLQALPGTVPWGVFFVYLNDYYAHDKGFSVPEATLLVMSVGIAAIVGGFIGGLAGQKLLNRKARNLPLLCAVTTILAVIPMAVLIEYPVRPGQSLLGPLIVGLLTGSLAAVTGPNVNTMLIAVNPPERRGSAFSFFNLCNDLGRGLGAWIVGGMAARLGRVSAFHIANLMWLGCGVVLLCLVFLFPKDERALQDRLRALSLRKLGRGE